MSEQRATRGTAGDMLRSIGVLLLIIAALWALWALNNEADTSGPPAVDYRPEIRTARATAAYRVLAPVELPEGWRATSARISEDGRFVHWHLGLLTGTEQYVGLEQYDGPPDDFASDYLADLRPADVVRIDGERWQLYLGEPDAALSRRADGALTIVVGTAPVAQMMDFTAGLS